MVLYDMSEVILKTGSEFNLYNKQTVINPYTGVPMSSPVFIKSFIGCLQPYQPNKETESLILNVQGGYVLKSKYQFYTTEKLDYDSTIKDNKGNKYVVLWIADWSFHGNYYEYILGAVEGG